jgi:hypothetical protein
MGMTDADDSMPSIEVKVLLTLIIPDATPLSLDGCHIKE